jgi:glycosyltransferase involved in cell wall biosynthesis
MKSVKAQTLATFAVFSYNQEKYIRACVESALAQTYSPLEIILSDDCSSDRTFAIMQEMASNYQGPHKVVLNRNPKNLGIGAHVNKISEISSGKYILKCDGDDVARSDRTTKTVEAFENATSQVFSVWCSARYIDESGNLANRTFVSPTAAYNDVTITANIAPVIGTTHGWRREVFSFFGNLNDNIVLEDNAISFRSYLMGEIVFIPEELVDYRVHVDSITNFRKIVDSVTLCALAVKRHRYALFSIDQRFKDLEFAEENLSPFNRNPVVLRKGLKAYRSKLEKRFMAYNDFPRVALITYFNAAADWDILKVILRSIKYRFTKLFSLTA